MATVLSLALAACTAACSCGGGTPAPAAAAPAAPKAPPPPPEPAVPAFLPQFVDVAAEAGLDAVNHTGKPAQKDWIVSGMGGGSIVLDYDQDGWMDLVVVDGTMLTAEGELEYHDDWRTRVYRNLGGMKFKDVTAKSGVDLKAFGFGGASCDYDADGWPDFYVCCWGRSYLYRNRGDGTFEEVAAKAGVRGADDDMSTACAWGDVNGDGIQDLYVANYIDQHAVIRQYRAEGRPGRSAIWRNIPVYVGPTGLPGQQDRLYFGKGDGTFEEVTATLPQEEPKRYGFQPLMTDLDNDGDLDIYVPNDTQANQLFVNDGKGKFKEMGVETALAMDYNGAKQASMGMDAADVNRDGWLDIVVTNFSHDHNTLYLNETGKTKSLFFRDLSNAYNVSAPGYTRLSWGTRLWDYDNDGNLDLFIACGHVYGEINNFKAMTGSTYQQKCLHMRGRPGPNYGFDDVTDASGPALQVQRVWRGAAFADFDNDGDQDVFVSALNDKHALFRNDGGNKSNFLVFRLVGKGRSRDPSGARVTVYLADGRPRVEELHHGASFCNDNDPRFFFGLSAETSAKRVEIRWPGEKKPSQVFENVAARKFWLVEQGAKELREDKR